MKALGVAVLVAALASLAAGSASAAIIGTGSALAWLAAGAEPCAELCDARWALDRMQGVMPPQVHHEFARRIDGGEPMRDDEVATGDVIIAVSYARAGIPLVDLTRWIAQFPQGVEFPAHGHAVVHAGREYRFVRVKSWDNWALIVDDPDGRVATLFRTSPDGPVRQGSGANFRAGGAGGSGGAGRSSLPPSPPGSGGLAPGLLPDILLPGPLPPDRLWPPTDRLSPTPDPVRPPVPMPVPLPGGLALLAGALAALAAPRLCRTALRR